LISRSGWIALARFRFFNSAAAKRAKAAWRRALKSLLRAGGNRAAQTLAYYVCA